MNKLILKVPNHQLLPQFNGVINKDFQQGFINYWRITTDNNGNEYATPQSFCWLFCWANNGKGFQKSGMKEARRIFQLAFGKFSFPNQKLYDFAKGKKHRYDKNLTYQQLDPLIP
jgi:hypothetical protein